MVAARVVTRLSRRSYSGVTGAQSCILAVYGSRFGPVAAMGDLRCIRLGHSLGLPSRVGICASVHSCVCRLFSCCARTWLFRCNGTVRHHVGLNSAYAHVLCYLRLYPGFGSELFVAPRLFCPVGVDGTLSTYRVASGRSSRSRLCVNCHLNSVVS